MLPDRRRGDSALSPPDPVSTPNRLPYRLERTAGGSLIFRRRWWPLSSPRDVPLVEDPHLGSVLFASLLGGVSLVLAAMSGEDESSIRRVLLLGLGAVAISTAIVRRARQAPFVVFHRSDRRLVVGDRSWAFEELSAARPRALALGDRDEEDFQVVLTLPTGETLPLARYGSAAAAHALVDEVGLILGR